MGIQLFGHVVWDITRGQLTQSLGNHIKPLVDETIFGFSQELPPCEGMCTSLLAAEQSFLASEVSFLSNNISCL